MAAFQAKQAQTIEPVLAREPNAGDLIWIPRLTFVMGGRPSSEPEDTSTSHVGFRCVKRVSV
ncbi:MULTISPECIES: hypothetical protein [unclassified Sinorhizobium]|uniref:hypothetical protein n=1 Tax=unclassified Sinorhizobium TaxID=2613772 RepID=UPI0035259416